MLDKMKHFRTVNIDFYEAIKHTTKFYGLNYKHYCQCRLFLFYLFLQKHTKHKTTTTITTTAQVPPYRSTP